MGGAVVTINAVHAVAWCLRDLIFCQLRVSRVILGDATLQVAHMNIRNRLALVSARSETYRILSEGKVNSTGARQRIQVVVHIGASDIETLSYREDL